MTVLEDLATPETPALGHRRRFGLGCWRRFEGPGALVELVLVEVVLPVVVELVELLLLA